MSHRADQKETAPEGVEGGPRIENPTPAGVSGSNRSGSLFPAQSYVVHVRKSDGSWRAFDSYDSLTLARIVAKHFAGLGVVVQIEEVPR